MLPKKCLGVLYPITHIYPESLDCHGGIHYAINTVAVGVRLTACYPPPCTCLCCLCKLLHVVLTRHAES